MRFVIKCKAKDLKDTITKAWRVAKYKQNGQAQE
tara:strand:- start:177 stop:278 length:102 start_codon:yes stop_codon:yes gene_type:complete